MILRAALMVILLGMQAQVPAWSGDAQSLPVASTAEIEYLLDRVSRSEHTFVRNGDDHSGPEAASHMRRKYEHFLKKGRIGDTEDFIDLAGTESLMSGKPYMVRLTDGHELRTAEWLRAELAAYRTNRGAALQ
jgi:hypothetical protein